MFKRNQGRKAHHKNFKDKERQTGDISMFCTLNRVTGEVYNCSNLSHACKSGFGNNKRTGTQDWLVIYRDKDCFVCI